MPPVPRRRSVDPVSSEPHFNPKWKGDLATQNGKTITGYGTSAIGGKLVGLTLTFDDGSTLTLNSEPLPSYIDVDLFVPVRTACGHGRTLGVLCSLCGPGGAR